MERKEENADTDQHGTQATGSMDQLAEDANKLLESAILFNLNMTFEQRIEAHENARYLVLDLIDAGKAHHAAQPQSAS